MRGSRQRVFRIQRIPADAISIISAALAGQPDAVPANPTWSSGPAQRPGSSLTQTPDAKHQAHFFAKAQLPQLVRRSHLETSAHHAPSSDGLTPPSSLPWPSPSGLSISSNMSSRSDRVTDTPMSKISCEKAVRSSLPSPSNSRVPDPTNQSRDTTNASRVAR